MALKEKDRTICWFTSPGRPQPPGLGQDEPGARSFSGVSHLGARGPSTWFIFCTASGARQDSNPSLPKPELSTLRHVATTLIFTVQELLSPGSFHPPKHLIEVVEECSIFTVY